MATLFTAMDSLGGRSLDAAAAFPYALKVMSWAAVLIAPMVLLYQGWTYWVFRHRIGVRTSRRTRRVCGPAAAPLSTGDRSLS